MANAFPTTIEAVDAEWLSTTLQPAGLSSGSLTTFEVEPIGVGVGIMGLLYRLRLEWSASADGPETVVVKLPSHDDVARHVARTFRFYEKEVCFYRDLGRVTPLATPACHAAHHDPITDDFVLVLDDITDREVYSQVDGCPPAVATTAARALARHHAAFANWARFDDPDLAWLPFGEDPPTPEGVIQGVTDAWEPFRTQFPELVTARLEDLVPRYLDAVRDLLALRVDRPVTLVHGDFRLDNLFFAGDDVMAIDWQICTKGNFAYDLAYFVTQSLTVEDRRAHEVEIIDAYLAELADEGIAHDRADFMEDYRRTVLFCLCYPLQGGAVELANDRARALLADMLERALAAIDDHDAAALLVG